MDRGTGTREGTVTLAFRILLVLILPSLVTKHTKPSPGSPKPLAKVLTPTLHPLYIFALGALPPHSCCESLAASCITIPILCSLQRLSRNSNNSTRNIDPDLILQEKCMPGASHQQSQLVFTTTP